MSFAALLSVLATLENGTPSSGAVPPRVVSVEVTGAERTSPGIVVDLLGLQTEELFTPEARARAERRLSELPVAKTTEIASTSRGSGGVAVNAVIDERRIVSLGLKSLGTIGSRALLKDELGIDISGPAGWGEVWSFGWRWAGNRPRYMVGLAAPAPGRLPGVAHFEGMWEHQTYFRLGAPGEPELIVREPHQRVSAGLTDWATSRVQWRGGVAMDRYFDRTYASLEGGTDVRFREDLISVNLDAGTWTPVDRGQQFSVGEVSLSWRISRDDLPRWSGFTGMRAATRQAPLAAWPTAGTGTRGTALLRGHGVLDNDVVTTEVFGRQLAYSTIEHQQQIYQGTFGRVALVGFLDMAKAWNRLNSPNPSRLQADIGTAVRLLAPEGGGTVQVAVGVGLRERSWALSAGWAGAWPRR
jgi:hypothetical protein